jgi:hypothetical protein
MLRYNWLNKPLSVASSWSCFDAFKYLWKPTILSTPVWIHINGKGQIICKSFYSTTSQQQPSILCLKCNTHNAYWSKFLHLLALMFQHGGSLHYILLHNWSNTDVWILQQTHKNVTHSHKYDEVRAPEVSHTANIYSLVISHCYLPYVVWVSEWVTLWLPCVWSCHAYGTASALRKQHENLSFLWQHHQRAAVW